MSVSRCKSGCWAALLTTVVAQALMAVHLSAGIASTEAISGSLTTEQLFSLHTLPEPLVPVDSQPSLEQNIALKTTLDSFQGRAQSDDFSSLENFLAANPKSPWRMAILTNLGLLYYHAGYYSKCIPTYRAAWDAGKTSTALKSKALADRAAGEYTKMLARLGRYPELKAFLKEAADRRFIGQGAELMTAGNEGAASMELKPEVSFRCGPLALSRILAVQGSPKWTDPAIIESRSTMKGMSLAEVAEISRQVGLNYQPAKRSPGAPLIMPSVIHWKVGHYAALLRKEGERYLTEDPTFQNATWPTLQTLETEASGYFLVPEGLLPKGWMAVGADEAKMVFGKGTTNQANPDNTGPDDHTPAPDNPQCRGMAGYDFHTMLASLKITDTPVGYSTPYGSPGDFTVVYTQREASQPANFNYTNLGPKWNINWLTYITDDPNNYASVSQGTPKGGKISFAMTVGTGSSSGHYVSVPQFKTHKIISRSTANPIPYEILNQDGSKDIFGQSDGSTVAPRKVFLTQHIDPTGNATTLTYDSQLRITRITDPLGKQLVVSYELSGDTYKITRVTDPFGRFATFSYDTQNRLVKIRDMVGIESAFTYDGDGNFINSLTTPYGTTTFTNSVNGRVRRVTATDPAGDTEVLESDDLENNAISSEGVTPQGMSVRNDVLFYRNSFYWDKKRWKEAPNDYNKAYLYHWMHDVDFSTMSGYLESERPPLQSRIWYNYPGQGEPAAVGTSNVPSAIGRVVEGGTQLTRRTVTSLGKVSQEIDPLGRETDYSYSADGIDLLGVTHAQTGGSIATLAAYTYNSQHLPLTYTDAAGQVTTYTWSAVGQLASIKNARNETTVLTYYTADTAGKQRSGRLYQIDGALPGNADVVTFDYDASGNVAQVTGPDGYYLNFTCDALDRLTRVTFPDGTYTETTFLALDPQTTRDRLGRLTHYVYNSIRRLTAVTDPANRTVQYQWCKCGDLQLLIDAMGRITTWKHDLAGRTTAKIYPDGSQIVYYYGPFSGNILSTIDEKNQVKTRRYNLDDTLAGITYTNAEHATPNVAFTYDPDYRRIKTMLDGIGTTTYAYNSIAAGTLGAGQVASVDGPLPDDTITYTYDELSRNTGYAINGVGETRAFDALGRILSTVNPLGTFGYTYVGATGRMDKVTYPNGMTCQYNYHPLASDFRLKDIIHTLPSNTQLSRYSYEYNVVGNIIRWTQISPQAGLRRSWLCGYDAADQLTSVASQDPDTLASLPAGQYGYTYDLAGNRLTEAIDGATTTASFNALNQLTSLIIGGASALPQQTYEWDAEDRLTAINYSGTNERSEFEYNGYGGCLGLREKQDAATTDYRRFALIGLELAEERDSNGATVKRRYFARGMQTSGTAGTLSARLSTMDHLGSTREVIANAAELRSAYDFDPWGRRILSAGASDETNLGISGHWFHSRSRLVRAPARNFDPSLGKWTSRDPLAEGMGENLYTYVDNDPINRFDPFGLWQVSLSGGAGVAGSVSFGNNGGSSPFNGRWNLNGSLGGGGGLAGSFDPNNEDPNQPYGCPDASSSYSGGLTGNIRGGLGPFLSGSARVQGILKGNSTAAGFSTSLTLGAKLGYGKFGIGGQGTGTLGIVAPTSTHGFYYGLNLKQRPITTLGGSTIIGITGGFTY